MASFHLWDYVVFIVMLLISAGIGVYVRFSGGKQKTTEVLKINLYLSYEENHFFCRSIYLQIDPCQYGL